MRTRAIILSTIVLAFMARPLQLPAASCILSNAPSQEACKPKCCASKACCDASKKSEAPVAPPLLNSGATNQQMLIAFVPISILGAIADVAHNRPVCGTVVVRAHWPPPLSATCIRLI